MASVLNNEIKQEFNMFGEIFKFYKKYYHPENTDEYWEAVMKDSGELHEKYKLPICKALLVAIINEFDRKATEEANKNGKTNGTSTT